jgi:hypothetical protein
LCWPGNEICDFPAGFARLVAVGQMAAFIQCDNFGIGNLFLDAVDLSLSAIFIVAPWIASTAH